MGNLEVRPVQSRRQLKQFIKLPWKIYRNDPNWVPPLLIDRMKHFNRSKNPFFQHNEAEFFLAYRNGEVVGRIGAILNRHHNEFHRDRAGFFGYLEAIDDFSVWQALMETAKEWLRRRDRDCILGPTNPSTNDEVGFLVEGFDSPPYFMMTHNPPYYVDMMNRLGFEKAKDLLAFLLDREHLVISPKLERVANAIVKKYNIRLRTVDLKHFARELEIVRDIYNDAWSRNWGFVPMTREEFDYVANDFKQIIDPELVLIAEVEGQPAGFSLALPNYNEVFRKIRNGRLFPFGWLTFLLNKNKIRSMRVITLGVKQRFQPLGLGSVFYLETIRRGLKRGYQEAEMSWILEDNELMTRPLRLINARVHKVYRIFQASL
ncbi:MAG: hypothetical protein D6715_00405 [Calditrichaeota bacterium]|nr:MAG: hypothetical protein D6715_00405 [Calditrichota bacterium]